MECPDFKNLQQVECNQRKNLPLVATISDSGDMSCGIFPQEWKVECPFTAEQVKEEPEILEYFKQDLIKIYSEFCDGKISITF